MKILHIVAGLTPGGGLAESIPLLALHQLTSKSSNTVSIAVCRCELSRTAQHVERAGVRIIRYAPSAPYSLYFSWSMLIHLAQEVRKADMVNIHSQWTFPVWWGVLLSMWYRKKRIMIPRGCFDPIRLSHSAWKKRMVGWLDRWFLRHADGIVVTSQAEKKWVEDFVNNACKKSSLPPLYVIPNGVYHPETQADVQPILGARPQERTVLSLGRLHPLKGLDLLIEAWAKIKAQNGLVMQGYRWNLVIAGPDEQGTKKQLCARMHHLGLCFRNMTEAGHDEATTSVEEKPVDIRLFDAVHGEDKWKLLRRADVFVLPSQSENFGIVVGEALACNVPVVMTDVGPWKEAASHDLVSGEAFCDPWRVQGALRFTEPTAESIAMGLMEMMALSDEARACRGQRGCEWVRAAFSWDAIAKQFLDVYETILAKSSKVTL